MAHERNETRTFLITYLKPQRARVTLLAVLLLANIGLQLLNPQIVGRFIDTARAGGSNRSLTLAALLFIGVALLSQAVSLAATYVSEIVSWTATNVLRRDLLLHCLRLDLQFHKDRTPGELIERVDGDVAALSNFFSQFVIQILGNGLLCVGVIVVLFTINRTIGLMFAVFATVLLLLLIRVQQMSMPARKAGRQSSAELFGFLEERLGGTEDLRSSGALHYTMLRLYEHMRRRLLRERHAAVMGSLTWMTPMFFADLAVGGVFLFCAAFFQQGVITLGTAYVIYFYTQVLIRPLIMITRQLEDFQKASAGMARIAELRQIQPSIVDGPGAELPDGPLGVEWKDVTFGYDEGSSVLQGIDFGIAPGRVLGILGRTGSGKTTITRLLFRLYDPVAGTIRLAGHNLRELKLADLRSRVGMVTQDVQLFHATLRENLTFFDTTVTDDQILGVLDTLGLLPWLATLPLGLDTVLAAGSGGVSAGEAQVLAMTRVFLKNPGLVLLDEASSRLDPATEHMIEHAVDTLLERRSGIVIAHRLRTVMRADDILILDGGRIVEYGPREELQRDPDSRFTSLLRTGMEEVLV